MKPTLIKLLAVTVLAFGAASGVAAQTPEFPCPQDDKACARSASLSSPVRTKSFWRPFFDRPLEQRVAAAPVELLQFLTLQNILEGFPNRPQTAAMPPDFMQDVEQALAEIPAVIRQRLVSRLAGIFFVKNLGGTGFTDYARGRWFESDAAYIVLDMDVLTPLTANGWATWKENTPFRLDPKFRLEARIASDGQNNRKNAIQYILLHEIAHVLSIGEKFHPPWDTKPQSLTAYDFARLSWDIKFPEQSYVSHFDARFTLRKQVVYYLGAKLSASQMGTVYDQLKGTNFATLYAATNPGDDFAESFVSYVNAVLLERPNEINIYEEGRLIKTYPSCWQHARCASKRSVLELLLQ